jgi:hydrogenase nickel incorporation protein HypB
MNTPGDTRDVRLRGYVSAEPGDARTVQVQKSLMTHNDEVARANREAFRGVLALNVTSSPGSGKTALLEATARATDGAMRLGVIVGDLETDNDAIRLQRAGAPSVQIATGTVCHLEAEMVARAVEALDLGAIDVLVIENVGNLVCPAAWDLGEDLRVVLLAVTEGEDKPLKYPRLFKGADVVIVNKVDIADAVGWDREQALANLEQVAPQAHVIELSARTGDGLEAWTGFLAGRLRAKRA